MNGLQLVLFVCLTAAVNIALGWLWAVWYQRSLARIAQSNLSLAGGGSDHQGNPTVPYELVDQFTRNWAQLSGRTRQDGQPTERLLWAVLFSTTGALEKLLELDRQLQQPGATSGSDDRLLRVLELAAQIVRMLQEGAAVCRRLPPGTKDTDLSVLGETWSDIARQMCDVAQHFTQGYQEMPWAHTEETRDCIVAVSELLHTLRDLLHHRLADYYRRTGQWSGLEDELLRGPHGQLWNRLGLEREAAFFWESISADTPVSVLLLDVDRFRRVQQQKGLYLGEQFVNALGEFTVQQLRSQRNFDRMGRLGGATFLVILGGTDLESAAQVAERLRQTIEASSFSFGPTPWEVTISCAVAAWHRAESLAEVEAKLRGALDEVRRRGRNRTCLFNGGEFRMVPVEPLGVKGHVVPVASLPVGFPSASESGSPLSAASDITGSEPVAVAGASGTN